MKNLLIIGCKYIGYLPALCVLFVGLGVFFVIFGFSLHTSRAFMQKMHIFAT